MATKFSDFQKEAERRERKAGVIKKPFEIELNSGEVVRIPFPDAQTYLALSEVGENRYLEQLRVLFGKNQSGFRKVIDELQDQPAQIIAVIVEDAYDFWGNDMVKQPGKSEQ